MKRRKFIVQSALALGGALVLNRMPLFAASFPAEKGFKGDDLYRLFQNPDLKYHPFVRWWWNGNKIEKNELIRELNLLKEAGIGGVEINPISFPSRIKGDDLGIKSLTWLSDEWIDMLMVTFDEAKRLGMTCDLIVGSGWPFGAETLKPEERAEVVLIYAEKIEGPAHFEILRSDIFKKVDPGVTVPCPDRTFEMLSLKMAPDPMNSLDQVTELSHLRNDKVISADVPAGKHVFYALVKVSSFASVINGAPGASGPILNHMDKAAVRKYLEHMSDTIQKKTGPLSNHLRAFFTDSMELEGCNWTKDFAEEFKKRRGYDIMAWLPFIMFKVGRLGGVIDEHYGAVKTPGFAEKINRVRFDFELTKAELLYERFTLTYLEWCKGQNVKSRAQAYGRGFFPLETSIGYDIPEGESWTTNWLKHRVGEEMSDEDYRRGRAYTMINKYVSSAAHLSGNRIVSCEEMTNTYLVFNTSLERLKIGSDQSIMSGITHSVWHGFNYSPLEAPYPGWIQYGSYYNEKNNWWPYFKYLNNYKARISALLQNADMYTDIAILTANYDLWSEKGVQTDPFPEKLNIPYTSLIWEAINKNGGAADYTSEIVINRSSVINGKLCYDPKKFGTIILAEISGINPETLAKLSDFVADGGRVFCIEKYPEKSLGLSNYEKRDNEVLALVEKLKTFPGRFILLKKPEDNKFLEWYSGVMTKYNIPSYLKIEKPDRFVMQNRYRSKESEIFFFANSNMHNEYSTRIEFNKEITARRQGWIWNPENGERYRINTGADGKYELRLGPAESRIIVFDRVKKGKDWQGEPAARKNEKEIAGPWQLEFIHCRGEAVSPAKLEVLKDIKDIPEYADFSGTIIYRQQIEITEPVPEYIDLGVAYGVTELIINGQSCDIKWYGNRIYKLNGLLKKGNNILEIKVITTMGNYMKSLTDNPIAQVWTNKGSKIQPLNPMGLIGPVTLFRDK
jgi:hypothetical protein